MLLRTILLGIAATNTADQVEIILIDPKQGVDYAGLDALPHLHRRGIIATPQEAMEQFERLLQIMDERYARFREKQVANWLAYNQKHGSQPLPAIWVFHDEFADWMTVDGYRQALLQHVSRLGARARAAGIFLVFATQRPDAQVMPPQLRTHFINRLVLKTDSEGTSEIALGDRGAEELLGRGHFLAKLEGYPLCFAQAPLVDDVTMTRVIATINDS